LGKLFCVFSQ